MLFLQLLFILPILAILSIVFLAVRICPHCET